MIDTEKVLKSIADKYPDLLSVDEACEIAHAPTKTLYDWSHRGLLDTCKISLGRRVLEQGLPPQEAVELLLSREPKPEHRG